MIPRCLPTTLRATGAVASLALGLALLSSPAQASTDATSTKAHGAEPASGTFEVGAPYSFQATPTRSGRRCILRVGVDLSLAGTVDGTASGQVTARVKAPCEDATTSPPGTYADTFRFTGEFTGTVAGVPASADVTYAGLTRAGGDVSALLLLRGGAKVVALVDAQAGVGGSYQGVAVSRR